MRVSVCLDPGRAWPEIRSLAVGAEALGVARVYVCDHFIPSSAGGRDADGPMLECWTLLAALAGCTTRIGLGSLVLGNTYRHPAVVANMAASLDRVTNGRLVLGLGAGWAPNEHAAYGIDLPAPAERSDRLEEACQVIRSLLAEEVTTFSGRWWRLVDARCDPKPVQRPLPLLIGGGGERRTLRTAARYADEWHVWAGPAEFARKSRILDRHCADAGRDPTTVARSTGASVRLLATDTAARGHLLDYRAAGADEFVASDEHDLPAGEVLDTLARLSRVASALAWG